MSANTATQPDPGGGVPFQFREFAPGGPWMTAFSGVAGSPDSETVPPGARCLVALREGRPVARLAWEMASDVRGVEGACGLIGWYGAEDLPAGAALLREARARLAARGAARILGPMDGSTWGRYRLVLPGGGAEPAEPPFLTEPQNPPEYPDHFAAAGFRLAALYESRIVRNLAVPRPGERALAERLGRSGLRVRALDPARPEEELELLFRFSSLAFQGNAYYRPLPFAPFREAGLRLFRVLDPELVRLAFDRDGDLLGFVFAFPDPLSAVAGRPTRVVLKTIASRPGARCRGLSAFLADQVHALAHAKGYRAVIHALMHSDNASLRISRRYDGEPFRRYGLYEAGPLRPPSAERPRP